MSKLVQYTGVHFPDLHPNWAIPEKKQGEQEGLRTWGIKKHVEIPRVN